MEKNWKRAMSSILYVFVVLASIVMIFVMAVLVTQLCLYIWTASQEVYSSIFTISSSSTHITVAIFETIDILLVVSFAFMTILLLFTQYIMKLEFVDKSWPWLTNMTHQDLKGKIADALVAITSIKLLGLIMAVGTPDFLLTEENIEILQYSAVIHIILVLSALLVKVMYRLENKI